MKTNKNTQITLLLLGLCCALCTLCLSCNRYADPQDIDIQLAEDWFIRSSADTALDGVQLSTEGTDFGSGWYEATVPSTVMGTLTANGLYADAFMGKNYAEIDRSQFDTTWWYRTSFEVPALKEGQRAELAFDGLSYRADVWLNGQQIASKDEFFGPFRQFSFDVTDVLQEKNNLAVRVFRWQKGEFNIGFVDWNPRPADESMGIFRPVWLRYSDAVALKNPAVRSKVDTTDWNEACFGSSPRRV